MALTAGDVALWAALEKQAAIPRDADVLEIGQANWYGDTPIPEGCEDVCPFNVARKWYKKILRCHMIVAIDMHGKHAIRHDLNKPLASVSRWHPLEIGQQFGIVINTGTAEHIFDQRTLFESIHDACTVGGLMVHAAPVHGWLDHGFYNYQPCFFADLAAANGYEVLYREAWTFRPRGDVMLYVALRKTREAGFMVPMQGKYRGLSVSP